MQGTRSYHCDSSGGCLPVGLGSYCALGKASTGGHRILRCLSTIIIQSYCAAVPIAIDDRSCMIETSAASHAEEWGTPPTWPWPRAYCLPRHSSVAVRDIDMHYIRGTSHLSYFEMYPSCSSYSFFPVALLIFLTASWVCTFVVLDSRERGFMFITFNGNYTIFCALPSGRIDAHDQSLIFPDGSVLHHMFVICGTTLPIWWSRYLA
jgi:hypothetical protein